MSRKTKFCFAVLLALTSVGCFATHEQRKYLNSLYGRSNILHIPSAKADSAWLRAKSFITTYATDSIEQMDDTLIRTRLPSFLEYLLWYPKNGYWVYRNITPTESVISVYDIPKHTLLTLGGHHNGEILIDYIASGRLPFPELIIK